MYIHTGNNKNTIEPLRVMSSYKFQGEGCANACEQSIRIVALWDMGNQRIKILAELQFFR